MDKSKQVAFFEGEQIRRCWDEENERWYFSIVDVVRSLTGSSIPKRYWSDLKKRLKNEGSQVYEKIVQLKFLSKDGKYYDSDAADTEDMFRVIQSIPSPKAEPFKLWLARVGYERIEEISDPERALDRSRRYWQRMGRSDKWIQQRMMGQEIRNKLTDYWKDNEVKEKDEFAILTNIIHEEWSDLTVKGHKELKNLNRENLRDHMTDAELVFTALAELSTREIAQTLEAKGLGENKVPAKQGGRVAKNARRELEERTGNSVVSPANFLKTKKPKRLK